MAGGGYSLFKRKSCVCAAPTRCACSWYLSIRRGSDPRFVVSLSKYRKARGITKPITSRGEAEDLAEAIAKDVADGTYSLKPPPSTPAPSAPGSTSSASEKTYADAGNADLATRASLDSIGNETKRHERICRVTLPGFSMSVGEMPLDVFDAPLVVALYAHLGDGKSESDKIKYRRSIKRAFAIAVRYGWLGRSPFADEAPRDPLLYAGTEAIRMERCRPELAKKLLDACDAIGGREGVFMRAFVETSIESGARPGELRALKRNDIEWDEGHLVISATEPGARKTGKRGQPGRARLAPIDPINSRIAVVVPPLLTTLDGRDLPGGAYVFHDGTGAKISYSSLNWLWKKLVARAFGIPLVYNSSGGNITAETAEAIRLANVHIYDLRHEAAHRWHEDGTVLRDIAKMLGHTNLQQLRVYLSIKDDDRIRC